MMQQESTIAIGNQTSMALDFVRYFDIFWERAYRGEAIIYEIAKACEVACKYAYSSAAAGA